MCGLKPVGMKSLLRAKTMPVPAHGISLQWHKRKLHYCKNTFQYIYDKKKNLPRTQHLSSITLQAVKFILWVFPMFVHTNKCWRNRVILSPSLLTSNELSAILLETRVCGVAVVFFWFLGTGEGITGQRASPELHQQCSLGSSVYSFYFRFMGNLIL